MHYQEFIDSLDRNTCPVELEPCLKALWYDAKGEWDTAHEIVQQIDDVTAARIHAYLHRKEGDDWKIIAEVTGNYQTKVVMDVPKVSSDNLRLKINATNGCKMAQVSEIRVYS